MVASSRMTASASPARSARTSAPLQKCLPSPRRTTTSNRGVGVQSIQRRDQQRERLSIQRIANVERAQMLVESSSIGDAFTIKADSLKVCSKLQRTGGGCAWSCSVDVLKGTTRFFTDQLSADFTVTCQ